MEPTEVLEIHLEEIARHYQGWRRLIAQANYLNLGTFRFVARPPGADHAAEDHVFGASFPVMGGPRDLDNRNTPNGQWIDLAEASLEKLDRQLVNDGWVRQADLGPYWWSRQYARHR